MARRPSSSGALALLGALTCTVAFAQDEAPSREPSAIRFARALAQRGWYDLAAMVLDDLARSSSTPRAVLEQAELLKADMLVDAATSEKDPEARRAKIQQARAFFEEFARRNAGKPAGNDAAMRAGEIYLEAGDAALARLRASDDSDQRKLDRAEAEESFEGATKFFKRVVDEFELPLTNADTGEPDDPEAYAEALYQLALANFLHAKSIYKRAQAYEPGEERDAALQKAVEAFTSVGFDFADQLPGYEAYIFLGLAEKDRGNLAEAIAAYDAAANLLQQVGGPPRRGHRLDPYSGDIISRALFLKAQAQNENGAFADALETAKLFRDCFADLFAQNNRLALSLQLEEAKAKAGSGDKAGALRLVRAVEAVDPQGWPGFVAREALGLIEGTSGSAAAGSDLDPERAMTAADAMMDAGKVAQGLARLRQLIADLEAGNDDQRKALPLAWYTLGRAYFERERFDEAYACFDRIGRHFATSEHAPRAIFYAANCAGRFKVDQPNPFDQGRYLAALDTLSRPQYASSPVSKAAAFLAGNELLGARNFVGAVAEYQKVTDAAGEFYDAALFQIGVVWMQEARAQLDKQAEGPAREAFGKALAAFQRCVEWSSGATGRGVDPSSERAGTLRKLGVEAWLRTAEVRMHDLMRDPAAALSAARSAETMLGPDGPPERIAEARAFMVDAHLAANAVADAEAALVRLVEVSPESRRTATAERNVAVALDAAAQAPAASSDERRSALERAADHYGRWLEVSAKAGQPIPYPNAARAGDRIFSIALVLNGLPPTTVSFTEVPDLAALPNAARFEQAAQAYALAVDDPPQGDAPAGLELWLVRVKLGTCQGFLRRFAEAARTIATAVEGERLLDPNQQINLTIARQKQALLYAYADAAQAAVNAGASDKAQLEWAIKALESLITVAPNGRDLWWRCKYEHMRALVLKGDRATAAVGLRSLRRTYPEFDGGQFGLREKFETLARDVGPGR